MDQQQLDLAKILQHATDILCPICQSDVFETVTMLKKISAIMSPSGQEMVAPLPAYRCVECKHVMEEGDMETTKEDTPKIELIKP